MLRWSRRSGAEGFKIGICWQSRGGVGGRSFSLSDLRGISEVPGIRLISLQKREAASDSPVGLELMDLGEDFDAGPDGFLDTAAAMMACDLVISTDTSVAHLAGALGVPTWLVLRHNPDWRWMKDRSDSPWYPTMRLFRQKTAGVWTPVFAEIRQALLEQLRDRQPT